MVLSVCHFCKKVLVRCEFLLEQIDTAPDNSSYSYAAIDLVEFIPLRLLVNTVKKFSFI